VMGVTLFAPCYNNYNVNAADPIAWQNPEGPSGWSMNFLDPVIKGFFNALIASTLAIAMAVAGAFMGLSQALLSMVVSPTFINVPFTSNPFVDEGLKITKDLANIVIVIGLVIIALSTILRISSYEMKKTLPLLLIVALLINFMPMFCGIAIDASNIVMNHFLKAGGLLTSGLVSTLGTDTAWAWLSEDPVVAFARGVSVLGFHIFGGLIFLLFAMLFLFRYVALWMLIILSPLALFCIIFPNTKKMWDMWLSQFIQWCFIGIPIAFTIHLANIITVELVEKGGIEGVSGATQVLGYLLPLTFLIAGFFMSLQIGAMGASIVTTRMKRASNAMGKAAGGIVGQKASGVVKTIKSVPKTFDRIAGRQHAARLKGYSRARAMFEAVRRPAGKGIVKHTGSAIKGILSAFATVGTAGAKAFVTAEKKGYKTCPVCGHTDVPKKADTCPYCDSPFKSAKKKP